MHEGAYPLKLIATMILILSGSRIHAAVTIHELLATGSSALLDEDGDASDWIELHSTEAAPVDLAGWFLTDDPGDLTKWRLPAVRLDPGGWLVVFASGKDRDDPAAPLHTSFRLRSEGEFLGLVRPDGATLADAFVPGFPPQRDGFSFGVGQESIETLIATGADVAVYVPRDDALGRTWTGSPGGEPFDDSEAAGWIHGRTGIGHDLGGVEDVLMPLAYWSFDDVGDPEIAVDASGQDRDGILTSTFETRGSGGTSKPVYTAAGGGHSGRPDDRALDFGASGDGAFVKVPSAAAGAFDSATANNAITISLWVFGGASQPAADLVFWGSDQPDGSGIRTLNVHIPWSDSVIYWDTAGCCDATQRISRADPEPDHWRGAWNHYVFVKDGDRKEIWQNGRLFHEGTNIAPLTAIRSFLIGGNETSMSYGGLIDDVALWDFALPPDSIAKLAEGVSPLELSSFAPRIETDLAGRLPGISTSVYARIPLEWTGGDEADALVLRVRYDSGFIAYLNGVEVARRNIAASVEAAPAVALSERPRGAALAPEDIDISGAMSLLVPGANILAFHAVTSSIDDADSLLLPELLTARHLPDRYLSPPTPGAANVAGVTDFVADTRFSVDRGFFDEPFDVEITCDTPGAEIYYTTDASAPAPAHPTAIRYTGPIAITTTTLLRAAAFKEDHEPSNVDTQSYLFLAEIASQPAQPPGRPATWSGGFPADYAVDPDVVTTTLPGYGLEDALLDIPSVSIVMDEADLFGPERGIYYHSSDKRERPGSVEFIYPDGSEGFQVDAGIRVHGHTSRQHTFTPKHSFRVLFKSQFGPAKLRRAIFPDCPVEEFDQLVLKGMSTDSWAVQDGWPLNNEAPGSRRWYREKAQYLREQWMKDSLRDMGQLSTYGIFVHLYLNGLYWGLYNLSERPTSTFQATHDSAAIREFTDDEADKDDYDVLKDFNELHEGSREIWDEMMALAAAGLGSDAAYQRIQGHAPDGTLDPGGTRYLDVDSLIDTMILHIYAGADDWPNHNWWAGRWRGTDSGLDEGTRARLDQGFRFFVWDQEISLQSLVYSHTSWGPRFEEVAAPGTPSYLYDRLRRNAAFRIRFMDRVHRHCFAGGALTPDSNDARWMARALETDRAIVGESARWGDAKRAVPFTREREWLAEQRWLREEYWPNIHAIALARFRRVDLYPDIAAPVFSHRSGSFAPGDDLIIQAASGTLVFTLHGSDPRAPDGSISPAAFIAETSSEARVDLDETVWLTARARVLEGSEWSALAEVTLFRDVPLRVTELMYHPAPPPPDSPLDDEDFEFVELVNVGDEPLDLDGLSIRGGIYFAFAAGIVRRLDPGEIVLIVKNRAALESRTPLVGVLVAGTYSGRLNNDGETLHLIGPHGQAIQSFRYFDQWYPETDGRGVSLVIADARADPETWAYRESWRPSDVEGGTPGWHAVPGSRHGQRPVDVNQDGELDISDGIGILRYLFIGDAGPLPCGDGTLAGEGNLQLLDTDGSGSVNLSDAVAVFDYLFRGGAPPALGTACVAIRGCPDVCRP